MGRYFHTVRYLRPILVLGRIRLLLPMPRADLRPAAASRSRPGGYVAPVAPLPTLIGPHRFRFLNVERHCATRADWEPADVSRLWTYNLHYFDDLNALDAGQRVAWHTALLLRWVLENPAG